MSCATEKHSVCAHEGEAEPNFPCRLNRTTGNLDDLMCTATSQEGEQWKTKLIMPDLLRTLTILITALGLYYAETTHELKR